MMFGQVMWLIGAAVFVFSTCIFGVTALKCESGGSCYLEYADVEELKFETKTCSDSCVYFKCFVGDYKIMEGAGCFEDFLNTCKYVDPQLLKEIKSNHHNYTVNSRSLILASCNRTDGCAKEMFYEIVPYNHRRLVDQFVFNPKYAKKEIITCEYDNTPKQILPKVNCETRGRCKAGRRFKFDHLKGEVGHLLYRRPSNGVTQICDACSKFLCTLDGKAIISGHGCFEDFERMCGAVMNDTIKNELKENQKNYFYADANIFMVTCSHSDNCQFEAFRNYYDVSFGLYEPPLLLRNYIRSCQYKPIVIPTTTTRVTTTESTTSTKTSSSFSATTTITTTEPVSTKSSSTTPTINTITVPVSIESTSQQKDKEEYINNSSEAKQLMFLVIVIFLFVLL